jgi:large subunit ribosomal protein L25
MNLTAQRRTPGKTSDLRAQGRLPGVVYNKELNIPVSVELREFDKAFRSQGVASLINLQLDGESHDVLVKAVQMDKRRREPLHVDFYAVTAGQPVDVFVPINFVGTAIGARDGGQVDAQRHQVHIRILPRLIPNHIDVDVSALAINDSLHLKDVLSALPSEAEVLDDLEETLITILPPRAEEPEEPAQAAEPEVIGEDGDSDDGDDAAA